MSGMPKKVESTKIYIEGIGFVPKKKAFHLRNAQSLKKINKCYRIKRIKTMIDKKIAKETYHIEPIT